MSLVVEKYSLGEEIDRLWELRERIRKLEDKVKEEKTIFDARQAALMTRIEEEGVAGAQGARAKVSVSTTTVPQVENWDEFYRYIHRNSAYHLLERRPAAAPYRELLATRKGKPVPGVVPFVKRTLNLRTV